jgi:hypothetical protein
MVLDIIKTKIWVVQINILVSTEPTTVNPQQI